MLNLRAVAQGAVQIAVRAQPKASRNAVVGLVGDRLKIAVTAAPADGKANLALRKTLARTLGVRPAAVEILAGRTARDKTVQVHGLSVDQVRAKLGDLLG